ncbi:MAG: phenylalanyl-tRNA synthetase subunit beta [uncultured bacterium]|nr:MAG: phenylalanyl-tRNA synthetase subunit beta [uncultured bacterium]
MDIKVPNSWLKKFLDTKATPYEIAKYLSLSGPSIERTKKTPDGDFIYNVEVTTNRVDTASILGIAREASAILPRFGISAKLKNTVHGLPFTVHKFVKRVKYLDVTVDETLCPRFTAVLIKNVTIKESPIEIKKLLEKVDARPINNIVDVSNYIMHELGQPVHTFDYDRISGAAMTLREAKKGELIKTLDDKEFKLEDGDIVIEDGTKKLIDLCGIMGGLNSAIDNNTKNVLLFVQNYDQHKIRKTSMMLGQRSEAAVLFEKGLDSENVKPAMLSAIHLIEKMSGGKAEKEILDIYPNPYKEKTVAITTEELNKIIGISISEKDIIKYMSDLGFESVLQVLQGETLQFRVPSWRANDIDIKEDIAEEIARIYGYHNLPCVLMNGSLPAPRTNPEFQIEKVIKNTLVSLGATEIYNSSLVSSGNIKLKNPLGLDTAYLRNNLRDSLTTDIKNNPQEKGYIHMFEVANLYVIKPHDLPNEKLTLAGIIKDGEYRRNKGIVEKLLDELNIKYSSKIDEGKDYLPNQRIEIKSGKETVGEYGNLECGLFYYEFGISELINAEKIERKYKEVAKYPPQVEDLTLVVPSKTPIGEVMSYVSNFDIHISNLQLVDIYENSFTFNVEYQSEDHTLTDNEVEKIRTKILSVLKSKFGISIKE